MKKNLEIIFVRHAQSYGNINLKEKIDFDSDDPSLTDKGLEQADFLSARFEKGDIDRIFASPLLRAVKTVRPIAEKLELKIHLLHDLMEFGTKIPCTDYQILRRETPLVLLPDYQVTSTLEGETFAEASLRAQRCIDYFLSECQENERILVVTHGTFLSYLVRCALEVDTDSFRVQADNCSITHIAFFADESPKLKYANDTTHLK